MTMSLIPLHLRRPTEDPLFATVQPGDSAEGASSLLLGPIPPPPPSPPYPPSQQEEREQSTNSISDRDEMTEPARTENTSGIMCSSMCYLKGPAVWPTDHPTEDRPATNPEACESQEDESHIPTVRAIGVPFIAEHLPRDGQASSLSDRRSSATDQEACESQQDESHITTVRAIGVPFVAAQLSRDGQASSFSDHQSSIPHVQDIKNLCFAIVIVLALTVITTSAIVCGGGHCTSTRDGYSPTPSVDSQRPNFTITTSLLQAPTQSEPSSPLQSPNVVSSAPTIHQTSIPSTSPSLMTDSIMPPSEPSLLSSPANSSQDLQPGFDASVDPSYLVPFRDPPSIAPSSLLSEISDALLPSPVPTDSPRPTNVSIPQPTMDPVLPLNITTNNQVLPGPRPTTASPTAGPTTTTTTRPTTSPSTATVTPTVTTGAPTSANVTTTLSPTMEFQPTANMTDNSTMIPVKLGDSEAFVLVPSYTILSLNESESAQSRALDFLSSNYGRNSLQAMPAWRRQQLFAMMSLYYSLDGDRLPHYTKASWMDPSVSECFWQGEFFNKYRVDSCSPKSRQINQLKLYSPHDASSPTPKNIPPELELLSSLEVLHIEFSGMQPSPLKQVLNPRLEKLRSLSLPISGLSGTIPTFIDEFRTLNELQLFGNKLSGRIPSEVGLLPDLQRLWLNGNSLSGELPSEMGLLTNLLHLKLNGNKFWGTLATEMGLLTKMTHLSLGYNSFVGNIPSELGLLSDLFHLDLSGNDFSGMVPEEICDLAHNHNLSRFLVDCSSEVFCPDRCNVPL